MDKLLGHRKAGRGNGNEFLVRWAGKDAATDPPTPWSDSYEPESGVADDLIHILSCIKFTHRSERQGRLKRTYIEWVLLAGSSLFLCEPCTFVC